MKANITGHKEVLHVEYMLSQKGGEALQNVFTTAIGRLMHPPTYKVG